MKTYADLVGDGGSNVLAQVQQQAARLQERLHSVRHIIAVVSGKGGVGKSTVTANLATAHAMQGYRVGVLDADINGPSIAKMLGVRSYTPQLTSHGVIPANGPLHMRVMSMDLFLPDDATPVRWKAPTQQEAFVWRGTMEMTTLRELLTDTVWGDLDCLFLDLPPGTDRLPNLVGLLPFMAGALMVTIPSQVSQLIVQKSLSIARDVLPERLIGLVDNMQGYVCPNCHALGDLFPESNSAATAATLQVPYLQGIPFDPALASASDRGHPLLLDHPDSLASRAFLDLAAAVQQFVAAHHRTGEDA
ncbi:Iron-sulfur cluster carrier protein [Candidatus Entotheonellaceae bacterium PAL068K]